MNTMKSVPLAKSARSHVNNKFGFLPPKQAETTKWSRVNLDCWGPKTIKM